MKLVRNLNDLKNGLHKRWPLGSEENVNLHYDYLQKINFSIQDLNHEIESWPPKTLKDVVFIIVLASWIKEAVINLRLLYPNSIKNGFKYSKESQLQQYSKYLSAVRSLVVAHPNSVDKHPDFQLTGNYICVDGRKEDIVRDFLPDSHFLHLDVTGMKEERRTSEEFYLYCYSKKDDKSKFFYYIGLPITDIIDTVHLFVDKIYEFDAYLSKQKRADYLGSDKHK